MKTDTMAALERSETLAAPPSLDSTVSLTSAERRVAELASDGMTNREIAQTLFVTVKTVEWHLRNTYVKLGIASRRELQGVTLTRRSAAA